MRLRDRGSKCQRGKPVPTVCNEDVYLVVPLAAGVSLGRSRMTGMNGKWLVRCVAIRIGSENGMTALPANSPWDCKQVPEPAIIAGNCESDGSQEYHSMTPDRWRGTPWRRPGTASGPGA